MSHRFAACWLFVAALSGLAGVCVAKPAERAMQKVNLPYVMRDALGTNWDVQVDGTIGDGGNDLYDGGARLMLDNNFTYASNQPQADFDDQRNELVLPPMSYRGLTVARRIAVDAKSSFIRYAEVLTNTTNAPVRAQIRIYFNMGGSVQNQQAVNEPRGKKNQIGLALGDNNNSLAIVGAGRGSRLVPRYQPQQGSDNVDLYYDVEVPARQVVAIVHVEARRASIPECVKLIEQTRDRDYLQTLPRELTSRVANFTGGSQFAGDVEVLRGETLDLVEVRGGDQYHGTLKAEKYRLKAFCGTVELPAGRVVGLINVGDYRPRQLLVTVDGEIFGGELESRDLSIELSSGQVTVLPIGSILRAGYRKRPGEPEEWTLDKSMVFMRAGDRIAVTPPSEPVSILTRYGTFRLDAAVIGSAIFLDRNPGVHRILLTDGSRFAGLVMGEGFDMKLAASGQPARFPASGIERLQFSAKIEEPERTDAVLLLANEDTLVGSITGQLKLETAFSTIALNAPEIRRLARSRKSAQDVQVELWDQTTVSGRLQEQEVAARLKCGVLMKVPVALVEEYVQPRPSPSPAAAQIIARLVAELSADDWQVRDDAQQRLLAMGHVVIGLLKEVRPRQAPEGQQRIDQIIAQLERTEK